MISQILIALAIAFGLISASAVVAPSSIQIEAECDCFECYHADAFDEYADEFTALFNSYETMWSKNNRLMIRQGDSGSFKFARKA